MLIGSQKGNKKAFWVQAAHPQHVLSRELLYNFLILSKHLIASRASHKGSMLWSNHLWSFQASIHTTSSPAAWPAELLVQGHLTSPTCKVWLP
eukprot:1161871-Pelagomonas_calceolata.AAC.10